MAALRIPEPANGGAPTEDDEGQVLEGLYGPPDTEGIYRANPVGEDAEGTGPSSDEEA